MEERLVYESSVGGFVVTTHAVTQHGAVVFDHSCTCCAGIFRKWLFGKPYLVIAGSSQSFDALNLDLLEHLHSIVAIYTKDIKSPLYVDALADLLSEKGVAYEIYEIRGSRSETQNLKRELNEAFQKSYDYWSTAALETQLNDDEKRRALSRM